LFKNDKFYGLKKPATEASAGTRWIGGWVGLRTGVDDREDDGNIILNYILVKQSRGFEGYLVSPEFMWYQ
jgi:hypothetical protein